MLQDIVSLIAIAAGLGAVVGAILASRAAWQSAVAAQEAAKYVEKVDRRALLRDLSAIAQRIISESLQIGALIEELKTEYRMFATLSGQTGGSREKLLIQRTESKQKEIDPLQEEARKLIEERARLGAASEDELAQLLSRFDGYLVQLLRIKDSLAREVTAAAGDNRVHRERRAKDLNRSR